MSTSVATSTSTDRAVAAGRKPRRFGSWYVAEHRIRGMRAYVQTLVSTSIGNPLVYLFALGVGLASLVDKNLSNGSGSVGYLAFVAPALLATAAVTVAAEESTFPILMGFKWNPFFYAMNAAPISGKQIVNGMIIAMSVRILPTCTIYYLVMLLFGAVPSVFGWLGVLSAGFAGLAVGVVIMSYTSTIEEDRGQLAMILRFGITPMFLFSGTFFPLTQLPIYLQWIGWISPLWHGTQLGRIFAYGLVEPAWLTAVHVLYLVGLAIFGWKLTQYFVVKRLDK
jgi:lipooligosaccharide transport system permease protein